MVEDVKNTKKAINILLDRARLRREYNKENGIKELNLYHYNRMHKSAGTVEWHFICKIRKITIAIWNEDTRVLNFLVGE